MNMRITRQQLAHVQAFEQFLKVRRALVTCLPGDLYESLFSIALKRYGNGSKTKLTAIYINNRISPYTNSG